MTTIAKQLQNSVPNSPRVNRRRALHLTAELNKVPGITCQPIDGAVIGMASVG